ncbi:hypothetical protein BDY17DRAFT_81140 [Neohortaea acidophila]|uniref:Uncharacterized protein n=1 Tax=Neohortaea acidophila TaxID=245834 RepID=A0A6A6Q550_9PEZI|nr:uncharacterized protein BDY17DRAFT_81140 [Neohortaea acidophila]KAF2486547.1 hypothetical protein BDY17DRAFT_81140 [Neohortaea acidophila]
MSTTNVPGITNPTKPSPTSNTNSKRLPAPTLFVGPPSRNASQLSLVKPSDNPAAKGSSARPLVFRQKSALGRNNYANIAADVSAHNNSTADYVSPDAAAGRGGNTLRKPSEKSINAKWREMQNTLNEVELTAQSSTHVFGESHARALDDLRAAQVALAKAWGRGSEAKGAAPETAADNAAAAVGEMNVGRFQATEDAEASKVGGAGGARHRAETGVSTSTVLSDESVMSEGGSTRSGRSQLEDETAQDIKLAGERRAANEAYFKRVDEGVKEVVEKLEAVAEAMRGVEGESRSLWSSTERSSESGGDEAKTSPRSVPAT